jgi:hypothetical protein
VRRDRDGAGSARLCVRLCLYRAHTHTQPTHVHVTPHPYVNKMQARNGRVHRTNFGGSPQSERRSLRYGTPNRKHFCTWTFKLFAERMVLCLNITCPRSYLSMDLSICVLTCTWQPGAILPLRIAGCRCLMYAYVHLPLYLSPSPSLSPVLAIRRERDSVREELENVLKDSRRENEILQESLQSGSSVLLVVFDVSSESFSTF